jgi:hypothetical protein
MGTLETPTGMCNIVKRDIKGREYPTMPLVKTVGKVT